MSDKGNVDGREDLSNHRRSISSRLGNTYNETSPLKRSRLSDSHASEHDSSRASDDSMLNSSFDSVQYNRSPATTPAGRDNKPGWYDIHEKHVRVACHSKTTLVLFGDSIIAGLTRYPKIWDNYFRPIRALNMGIGGDRTQHVLWRAENFTLPENTESVVLHCGTNNIDRDSPHDIANGVASVGLTLQENKPGLKVIVTGLLPRDLHYSYRRKKIINTNKLLKKLCHHTLKNFYYMKQADDWLLEDGMLNEKLYHVDYLHLIEAGNEKFAKAIISMSKSVKKDEVVYSDDESDASDDNGHDRSFKFERQQGVQRHKRRRSVSPENSRKRARSDHRESHSSPHKWHKSDASPSHTWSSARKWSKVIKKEFHEKYARVEASENPNHDMHDARELSNTEVDDKVEGTAKSIDINLDEQKRLEARRAKFGIAKTSPEKKDLAKLSAVSKMELAKKTRTKTIPPSALVRKIHESQVKARRELSQKKLKRRKSLVGYDSPSSSQDDSKEGVKTPAKTFFSDYASGSESE